MLPAGKLDEVDLEPVPPHPAYQPAASSVHYTTSCKHGLVLLGMGEIIARNMLIGIINKLLLLHLVGCLYYCISDARSYKQKNFSFFHILYDLHRLHILLNAQ